MAKNLGYDDRRAGRELRVSAEVRSVKALFGQFSSEFRDTDFTIPVNVSQHLQTADLLCPPYLWKTIDWHESRLTRW